MARVLANASEALAPVTALQDAPGHLSFSQLLTLSPSYKLSCPRKWAYGRLMGLQSRPGAPMLLGKAVDSAVQEYWIARIADSPQPERRAIIALEQALTDSDWPPYVASNVEGYWRIATEGLLAYVEVHANHEPPATLQQEHTFTVRGHDGQLVTVLGYSDYIARDGTIVDLKWTGAAKWNREGVWQSDWVEEKRAQLTVYFMARLAAERRGDGDGTPVIPKGRLAVITHALTRRAPQVRLLDLDLTATDVGSLVAMIQDADAVARGDVHIPRPGPACQFCPYTERCRRDMSRAVIPTSELLG